MPLRPELGGFGECEIWCQSAEVAADSVPVGKLNPYGRSFPHGYYKTVY
jgi:hypothetical protein